MKVSVHMCFLQNLAFVMALAIFGIMFGYMGRYQHDRKVFHHTFFPYNCSVENITKSVFTILVQDQWTVTQKNLKCSDIFNSKNSTCVNESFTGYFNPTTHILYVKDIYELSMVPEMIIFGLLATLLLCVFGSITCSVNKRIWKERKDRERDLLLV